MQEIIVFVCVNEIIVFIVTLFIVWVVVTGWSFFVTGGMQGYIYPKLLPLCLYWFSWSLRIFLLVICYSLLGSFRTKVLPCVWSRLCILLQSGSRLPLAPCCRSYINVRYLAQPVLWYLPVSIASLCVLVLSLAISHIMFWDSTVRYFSSL